MHKIKNRILSLKLENNKKVVKMILISSVFLVKVLLAGLFSSDFQDHMFIPFVNCLLDGNDPYTYFFENHFPQSFPYFPLMLYVECMGGLLAKGAQNLFLRNFLFKIPLFLFDFIAYYYIRKIGVRFKYACVFYLMSPIILYGTYMHGQLDVIPTALLVAAVYYLTNWRQKNHLIIYAVILGFSLSTKFHIVAAVPLLAIYVSKKKNIRWGAGTTAITAFTVACVTFPFISDGFNRTVLQNDEQSVLLTVGLEYGSLKVLFPLLTVLLIYVKAFELDYFNRDLLISMIGMLFAVFLICVPSAPAWFTWVVPFLTMYFGYVSKSKYKMIGIYFVFHAVYLVYFIFLYRTENVDLYFLGRSLQYLKIENESVRSIGFTVLVTLLAVIIYKIFRFGIESNGLYQRGDIPFTIGISGDSGTGKSRMIEKIQDLFGGDGDVLIVEGDGDHKWERHDENWKRFTALDPKANYLYRQANDIRNLRHGNRVGRRDYDHDMGVFTERKRIRPKKYMVVSGLHVLYLPQLREELDLKIFMDTDRNLQKYWKVKRDMTQRRHELDDILSEIDRRIDDAEKYILPQKQYADIVITYYDSSLGNFLDMDHEEDLSVKFCLPLSYNLESVVSGLEMDGMEVVHAITENFQMQEMDVNCQGIERLSVNYEKIAGNAIPQYEDLFTSPPKWRQGMEGVVQLVLIKVISQKMLGGAR